MWWDELDTGIQRRKAAASAVPSTGMGKQGNAETSPYGVKFDNVGATCHHHADATEPCPPKGDGRAKRIDRHANGAVCTVPFLPLLDSAH
eukprot:symbB.v1.2.028751.t2/scaffold3072.1/size64214/2